MDRELKAHLAPLKPRGQGHVREPGIKVSRPAEEVVEVLHPTLGRYLLHLDGLRLESESDPHRAATLEGGVWYLSDQDERTRITAERKTLTGTAARSYSVSGIRLERLDVEADPGNCAACGSRRLKIRLPLEFPVTVEGEGKVRWDGSGEFANCLATASCAECGTAHPIVSVAGFDGLINGVEISRGGGVKKTDIGPILAEIPAKVDWP